MISRTSIHGFLLMAILTSSCQLPFAESIYVKRDRFGESPVQDLRTGKSHMEWHYEEDIRRATQANLAREEEERIEQQERVQRAAEVEKKPMKNDAEMNDEESWFSGWFD